MGRREVRQAYGGMRISDNVLNEYVRSCVLDNAAANLDTLDNQTPDSIPSRATVLHPQSRPVSIRSLLVCQGHKKCTV